MNGSIMTSKSRAGGKRMAGKSRSCAGQGRSTWPLGEVTTTFCDFPVTFANWRAD